MRADSDASVVVVRLPVPGLWGAASLAWWWSRREPPPPAPSAPPGSGAACGGRRRRCPRSPRPCGCAEGGHAGGADAVLDDPEELGVVVALQGPVDVRRRRVHALRELRPLHPGRAVAGQAVLDVVLTAAGDDAGSEGSVTCSPAPLRRTASNFAVMAMRSTRSAGVVAAMGRRPVCTRKAPAAPGEQKHDDDPEQELLHAPPR